MIIEVGNLHARVMQADDAERSWISDYLAFEDDASRYRRKAGSKDGRIRLFNLFASTFPSGFVPMVRKAGADEGFNVQVLDRRVAPAVADANADIAWLRSYQHEAVAAVEERTRGILHMPTGCLTGETLLGLNRAGKGFKMALREVVARFNGTSSLNGPAWDARIPTMVRAPLPDGSVRLCTILSAQESGHKPVYEIRTAATRVRATACHRFMTPFGWRRLDEIAVGDFVLIDGGIAPARKHAQKKPWYKLLTLREHPYAGRRGVHPRKGGWTVSEHRLVAEARDNGMTLPVFMQAVRAGQPDLRFLDPKVRVVHHADRNPRNNDPSNLIVMTHEDHRQEHASESADNLTARLLPAEVQSIEYVGERPTFDIEVDRASAFIADGIAVHNSGKTEVAAGLALRLPVLWLFLVHRTNLGTQAAERFERRTGLAAGRIGEGAWDVPEDARFVCATFQTLSRALEKGDPRAVGLLGRAEGIIVDECFPAGTLVGSKRIENIQPGDLVPSFSETTGTAVQRRVLRKIASRPSALVCLHLADGERIVCTPDHQLLTSNGWVPAYRLCGQDVLSFGDANPSLLGLQDTVEACHNQRQPGGFLCDLPAHSSCGAGEIGGGSLRYVQQGDLTSRSLGAGASETAEDLLLEGVPQRRVVGKLDTHGNARRLEALGSDGEGEPNDLTKGHRAYGEDTTREGRLEAGAPRLGLPEADFTSASAVGIARMADGSFRFDGETWRLPPRHSEPIDDGRGGDRWSQSLGEEEASRRASRRLPSLTRVDRVEILEPGSDGTFGGVCPEGFVYNLVVEGTGTYRVGSAGLVTLNCHVLPAGSFYRVALATPRAYWRVGLSGTPLARGDKRSLLAVGAIGPVIYKLPTAQLVEEGVLAKPHIRMVHVRQTVDAPTWQGVYGMAVVRSAVRNRVVVDCAMRAEKPSLVFVQQVAHGKLVEKALWRAGIKCAFVWGNASSDMRNTKVKDLLAGRIDVLVCSVIFQEGTDIPDLRSVVIASGGKSVIAALQRIGRGMRTAAGKTTFEVWDVADKGCGCRGLQHKGCRWLDKHTAARLRAYGAEGHTITIDQGLTPATVPARKIAREDIDEAEPIE